MRRLPRDGATEKLRRIAGPRGLLREEKSRGYPVEYLRSRIRGRRSHLIGDWRVLVAGAAPLEYLASSQYQGFIRTSTAEGLWHALLKEYGWVFGQMQEGERRAFAAYFLYAELRTIFICLRYLKSDKAWKAEVVLADSLLAEELKSALHGSDAAMAVAKLEELFGQLSPDFLDLAVLYDEKGLREVERILTNRFLLYVAALPLDPVLRDFFMRIIDARNVMALYKSLQLDKEDASAFIPGGSLALERLREVVETGDMFKAAVLLRQLTGIKNSVLAATQVEVILYKGITRFLRKVSRDPLAAGVILDYLWRCSLEVMNLSMIVAGKDLAGEEIAAEMVH